MVPQFSAVEFDERHLALVGEEERHLVAAETVGRVLALADGTRTASEIVQLVSDRLSPTDAHYALALAQERGYLTQAPAVEHEMLRYLEVIGGAPTIAEQVFEDVRVDVIALGALDPEPMTQMLRDCQLAVGVDPTLTVVLVSDYLDPRLEELNRRFRRERRTWIPVKPTGIRAWVGPWFSDQGPCWRCLAQRLEVNRPLEHWLRKTGKMSGTVPQIDHGGSRNLAMAFAAEQIARWIARPDAINPDRALMTFDLRGFNVEAHPVGQRPQCVVCGNPDWVRQRMESALVLQTRPIGEIEGGYRTVSPTAVLERCRRLVDSVTGALVALEPVLEREHELQTVVRGHYFAVPGADTPTVERVVRCSLGKGRSRTQATVSALGEAIERYSASFQGDEPRIFAPREQVADAVDFRELLLFSDEQYRNRDIENGRQQTRAEYVPPRYDERRAMHWTRVWSLTRPGRSRFVPSALCYVGLPESDEAELFPYNSNGDAAGSCVEEAILQALFEVIERDAVGIWWYNRLVRPEVDLSSFSDPFLESLCEHYAEKNLEIRLLDVTSDLEIPTFVAYAETPDRRQFSIGFGCHWDPRIAAERALTEFNQLYDPASIPRLPWQPDEIDEPSFLRPDPAVPKRRFAPVEPARDLREVVDSIVNALAAAGLETLVLDRSRPDLELAVVRVIVPNLRHFWRRLAPGRLYTVPVQMGWRSQALCESELNPVPLRL